MARGRISMQSVHQPLTVGVSLTEHLEGDPADVGEELVDEDHCDDGFAGGDVWVASVVALLVQRLADCPDCMSVAFPTVCLPIKTTKMPTVEVSQRVRRLNRLTTRAPPIAVTRLKAWSTPLIINWSWEEVYPTELRMSER